MYMDDQTPSNRNVPMPSQAAGTITFHRHEGVVELSGVSPVGLFFVGDLVDEMLKKRKRTLVASTDIGKVTLYQCRSKTTPYSNNCARAIISFRVALLTQSDDRYAKEGDELEVSFDLDASRLKGLWADHIDANRNDDSSTLQFSAQPKRPLGSTQRNEEGYHLQAGSEGTYERGHYINIRSSLSVRRTWKWGGDILIWKDVDDRIAAIRSALAVLLGHVPDHRPLTIQAKADERAVNVGTMLICDGYKDAKEALDDASFLVDPHDDGDHFINVVANWSQRYMNDAKFRAAVHWAEWSTIFRPTTEHALVNTWMACSKLGLNVKGWSNGHIERRLDVELDGFDVVLRQAKSCRNYIEHAVPRDSSWNYDNPRILHFLRDTVDFYFYAYVLVQCGWDVDKWPSRAPHHPMGQYVQKYEKNREYAQQTTLKPPAG